MNNNELSIEARKVIDTSLTPPDPYRGRGKIKLIILGQDPEYRKKIKVTLLLNQPGGLRRYLGDICNALDIDLDENIYATNLLKNFFTVPPDTIRKKNPQFFRKAADHWIPLLREEIDGVYRINSIDNK